SDRRPLRRLTHTTRPPGPAKGRAVSFVGSKRRGGTGMALLDKKHIGHKFNAFTTTVEAGKIRLFCKAIGEDNPIYADKAAAKAAGYRAIPAPPTSLTAVTNDDADKGGLLRLLNVDIGLILHGEQHYEYLAPV